jgi:hypothetical protein
MGCRHADSIASSRLTFATAFASMIRADLISRMDILSSSSPHEAGIRGISTGMNRTRRLFYHSRKRNFGSRDFQIRMRIDRAKGDAISQQIFSR